jgi:hypothetical protein
MQVRISREHIAKTREETKTPALLPNTLVRVAHDVEHVERGADVHVARCAFRDGRPAEYQAKRAKSYRD